MLSISVTMHHKRITFPALREIRAARPVPVGSAPLAPSLWGTPRRAPRPCGTGAGPRAALPSASGLFHTSHRGMAPARFTDVARTRCAAARL